MPTTLLILIRARDCRIFDAKQAHKLRARGLSVMESELDECSLF